MTRHSWRLTITISIILGVVTLAVFWPVRNFEFILYDDGQYIFENPHVASGLSWANLVWAATQFHSGNWHPATWISHMVDVQLFGMNPGMHHLTNAFLHSANAILLFLLLNALTGAVGRSAVIAALFALHPAHVESVAWIAERKDLLSTFFGLLTLLAYVKYVSSVERGRQEKFEIRSSRPETILTNEKQRSAFGGIPAKYPAFFYSLALLCFAFGLMSKPMLVTLPFVMLLIDFWPLDRITNFNDGRSRVAKRIFLEKIPFLCLTIASCVITFLAQKSEGAVDTFQRVPVGARLANALIAYADYLEKLVWPSKLAILYLRPEHWAVSKVVFAVVLLVGLTLLVGFGSRGRPWMAVGWLWFLGTLVPVIGLIQVGNQYMADRYTYIPYVGCFILNAWGAWELARNSLVGKAAAISAALILTLAAAMLTHRQLQFWKNSETLFGHCLAVTTNNFSAHNILGVAMARQNRFEEAKYHFSEALRIQPQYADSLQNLGILLTEHGDFNEALPFLRRAVDIRPESAVVFSKLGLLLDTKDQPQQAIVYYRECLRWRPNQEDACNNLAWLLATCPEDRLRDGAESVRIAEHICEVTGYQRAALIGTLAAAYAEAGRFREAIEAAEKAIQVATASGETALVGRNKELLELYQAGKPYREPPGKASPSQ